MLTQRDIAAEVGVSVATVSLVLSGNDAGRVKPQIAERVREAADALGYVPNQLAQSLRKGQTHTIGLVSDEVATVPFSGHLLAGAQRRAWQEGYLLLVIDVGGNQALLSTAVQSLLQRNIEALVFATSYHRELVLPHVPVTMPVVVLDGRPADAASCADCVVPDERLGARAAVEHLIAAGHTRIGLCNVTSRYPLAGSLRAQGYRDALAAAGIEVDPGLVVEARDAATRDAEAPARQLLERADRPSAVFCFSDQIAMGFYQVATMLDLRVPQDLSIVGFDNQRYVAEALRPGLTTVQLPHEEMGVWAMDRALRRIRGEITVGSYDAFLMPCPLVIRDSVASPHYLSSR